MTEEIVRAVNIAVLTFSSLEAIIMLISFKKETLKVRSSRIFFAKLVVTVFTMILYTVSFVHHPEPRDAVSTITLALAYIGIYAVYYLYIMYLTEQIAQFDSENRVPVWVSYFSLVVCVVGALLWVLSIVDDNFTSLNEGFTELGAAFAVV